MGREAILKSVKENKPTLIPLPVLDLNNFIEDINNHTISRNIIFKK